MWINPLDKLPQVPVDWANHIIYGGVIFTVSSVFYQPLYGLLLVAGINAAKKVVDHFLEKESWVLCAGKTAASIVWPASYFMVYACHSH